MRKLQKAGVDLSGKGRAVQESIWSTSVQFGGGTSLIQKALAGKDAQTMSDAEIVSAVQDYKLEHNEQLFKSSSANQRAGTLKRAAQEKADLLQVAEMPQTWVGEKSSSKEPGLSSFVKNKESEQIPNLETNQTQTHNLITQKYNISQTEKDKSATKVFAQSEINKPQLIGEVNQKEEPLGERPTDAFGAQMWDIRKAEIEGKTNQLEPLGEKPKDDLGGQLWETRKAEMEAKANPNKVEPLGERPVDEQSAQMWDIRKAEMEGGISENPIMDELGSYLPSINEAPSVIPAVENEITSGLKGVTDIFSNVGTLITGAVGAIGGGDKKQSPMVVQAPAADSAGHGGNMMSVRNDDPLLLTLQYGNLRTV
jgi:hypothetical protein